MITTTPVSTDLRVGDVITMDAPVHYSWSKRMWAWLFSVSLPPMELRTYVISGRSVSV